MPQIPSQVQAARVYVAGQTVYAMSEVELPEVESMATEIDSMATSGVLNVVIPGRLAAMNCTFKPQSFGGASLRQIGPAATSVDVRFVVAEHDTLTGLVLSIPYRAVMTVAAKKLGTPSVKGGQEDGSEIECAVSYYRLERAGATLYEVDPANMIFKVGAIDYLAAVRAML